MISIVFGGLFLFQVYKKFGMLSFMFTDIKAKWDFSMILYFFPLLIIPIAVLFFYKRKKIGWTLMAIYLSYAAISAILLFLLTLNTRPSVIPALNKMFPPMSTIAPLLALLFFGGILWFICNEKIREVYHIDKRTMVITIVLIGSFTTLINFGLGI